jgi:uncharacterized protein YcfJ
MKACAERRRSACAERRRSALVGTTVLISLLAVASQAEANPWQRGGAPARYDGGVYDYAKVVDVDPIMRQVRVETPRRECWNEVREVRDTRDSHSKGGMVLGGIIGGVVGHQIGHGHGRDVATVAGTLIGAAVGHDIAAERAAYRYSEPREESVERCAVRYEQDYHERIEGYRVTYRYQGREYTTRLPYDPGDRIRIRVDVEPAE